MPIQGIRSLNRSWPNFDKAMDIANNNVRLVNLKVLYTILYADRKVSWFSSVEKKISERR